MRKTYKNMSLVLTNKEADEIVLDYEIRQNEVSQIWAQSVEKANLTGIYEDRRFYNWQGHPSDEDVRILVGKLEGILGRLTKAHPDIKFPRLEKERLQESLNDLHQNFAHGNLVEDFAKQEHRDTWSEFNVCIHAIESAIAAVRTVKTTGIPDSRLVVTWRESQRREFDESHYKEFEAEIYFGHAYLNYSQVGRNLLELYHSGDDDLPLEHIQPARWMSADTSFWFGPSSGHWSASSYLAQVKVWFDRHQEKFNKLGIFWGDPKCALGRIAVGRLKNLPYTKSEILAYQENLRPYTQVKSLSVD